MNTVTKLGKEKRFLLILDESTRIQLDELSEEASVSRAAFVRLLIRTAYKIKEDSNINIVFDDIAKLSNSKYNV